MRKAAIALSLIAGAMVLVIGIYLLAKHPSIDRKWMSVWVEEMEVGSAFRFHNAATVLGWCAIVFAVLVFIGAWLINSRFVAGGILIVLLDIVALGMIVICPNPKMAVWIWAAPGLLMAVVGFLLGMHLERVQKPEGVAELP